MIWKSWESVQETSDSHVTLKICCASKHSGSPKPIQQFRTGEVVKLFMFKILKLLLHNSMHYGFSKWSFRKCTLIHHSKTLLWFLSWLGGCNSHNVCHCLTSAWLFLISLPSVSLRPSNINSHCPSSMKAFAWTFFSSWVHNISSWGVSHPLF